MGRGTNRWRRVEVLETIGETDPELHRELLELRRYNPQAFRKRIRVLGKKLFGQRIPMGGRGATPVPWDDSRHQQRVSIMEKLQPYVEQMLAEAARAEAEGEAGSKASEGGRGVRLDVHDKDDGDEGS